MTNPRQNKTEQVNDAVKFIMWAIGIGAGTTLAMLSYASATFMTKELSASNQKAIEAEFINVKSAVVEIKESNKEFQKWLQDYLQRRDAKRN